MSASDKGKLVLWRDDKGFGFVRPETGDKDFFIHISAFKKGMIRRPQVGDIIHFQASPDAPEQRRIAHAEIEGVGSGQTDAGGRKSEARLHPIFLKTLAALPILLSFHLVWTTANPIPLVSYVFMSVLTVLYYGVDKKHALIDRWRVPEVYLHCFEMMGGWPGALLAQTEFHHKTRKSHYQHIFWGIVILHGLGWLLFLYAEFLLNSN
jgi:uncharacterized membrane protein YsdA (DUF1294 family)/cold shock CspA family protein